MFRDFYRKEHDNCKIDIEKSRGSLFELLLR